ncbi:MAG: 50S ribosomal protein L3 [Candidatus Paceibacterota bacterium]|nr:MAG: 50S ribosomal protein L3 [Candidatus Paceibacterota bacterium]
MAKFILGTKESMTQIFREDGVVVPVTVLSVRPNVVLQLKNKERDGYVAVQVGTGSRKHVKKPQAGHFRGRGTFNAVREFAYTHLGDKELAEGDSFDASVFAVGDTVTVSGTSKGKGFAGAMKRHGFSGMPASHGHRSVQRHIGSTGQRFPQHTLKGKRMAGHMGVARVSVRGLKVVAVDPELGIIAVRGAVPGQRGSIVEIVSR